MNQIGPGDNQHIYMPSSYQSGYDLSHSRRDHRAGYGQEFGEISLEHLLIYVHGLGEPSGSKATVAHPLHQRIDAHPRLNLQLMHYLHLITSIMIIFPQNVPENCD
ncbi:MAG: hypothetical protein CG440_1123 [Methanosaeta sp. NSM2]|nr:MAG: hypothetical protein CG440_1123 [Methanosaeta sp. NSM2]